MGDRSPFHLFKECDNRNRDIGEDKDWESEGVKNLFPCRAVNLVPFGDGGQQAEEIEDTIKIEEGAGDCHEGCGDNCSVITQAEHADHQEHEVGKHARNGDKHCRGNCHEHVIAGKATAFDN